jgi:hypothetical protein
MDAKTEALVKEIFQACPSLSSHLGQIIFKNDQRASKLAANFLVRFRNFGIVTLDNFVDDQIVFGNYIQVLSNWEDADDVLFSLRNYRFFVSLELKVDSLYYHCHFNVLHNDHNKVKSDLVGMGDKVSILEAANWQRGTMAYLSPFGNKKSPILADHDQICVFFGWVNICFPAKAADFAKTNEKFFTENYFNFITDFNTFINNNPGNLLNNCSGSSRPVFSSVELSPSPEKKETFCLFVEHQFQRVESVIQEKNFFVDVSKNINLTIKKINTAKQNWVSGFNRAVEFLTDPDRNNPKSVAAEVASVSVFAIISPPGIGKTMFINQLREMSLLVPQTFNVFVIEPSDDGVSFDSMRRLCLKFDVEFNEKENDATQLLQDLCDSVTFNIVVLDEASVNSPFLKNVAKFKACTSNLQDSYATFSAKWLNNVTIKRCVFLVLANNNPFLTLLTDPLENAAIQRRVSVLNLNELFIELSGNLDKALDSLSSRLWSHSYTTLMQNTLKNIFLNLGIKADKFVINPGQSFLPTQPREFCDFDLGQVLSMLLEKSHRLEDDLSKYLRIKIADLLNQLQNSFYTSVLHEKVADNIRETLKLTAGDDVSEEAETVGKLIQQREAAKSFGKVIHFQSVLQDYEAIPTINRFMFMNYQCKIADALIDSIWKTPSVVSNSKKCGWFKFSKTTEYQRFMTEISDFYLYIKNKYLIDDGLLCTIFTFDELTSPKNQRHAMHCAFNYDTDFLSRSFSRNIVSAVIYSFFIFMSDQKNLNESMELINALMKHVNKILEALSKILNSLGVETNTDQRIKELYRSDLFDQLIASVILNRPSVYCFATPKFISSNFTNKWQRIKETYEKWTKSLKYGTSTYNLISACFYVFKHDVWNEKYKKHKGGDDDGGGHDSKMETSGSLSLKRPRPTGGISDKLQTLNMDSSMVMESSPMTSGFNSPQPKKISIMPFLSDSKQFDSTTRERDTMSQTQPEKFEEEKKSYLEKSAEVKKIYNKK